MVLNYKIKIIGLRFHFEALGFNCQYVEPTWSINLLIYKKVKMWFHNIRFFFFFFIFFFITKWLRIIFTLDKNKSGKKIKCGRDV